MTLGVKMNLEALGVVFMDESDCKNQPELSNFLILNFPGDKMAYDALNSQFFRPSH